MFALVIVTNKMIIGLHLIVILMTGVSGLTNYQQDCVNVCEDQHIFSSICSFYLWNDMGMVTRSILMLMRKEC